MAARVRPSAGIAIFYSLYALDSVLPELGTPTKAKLEDAMKWYEIAHAELIGTYQKHK